MGKSPFLVLLLSLSFLLGCSRGRNTGALGGGTGSVGQLYVSTGSGIVRFSNALALTGNVAPAATISGSATTLSTPQHLVADPAANRLFVANQGAASILIFESVSTVNGNVAPTRTISGAATLLAAPHDLALDTTNNTLYVADGTQILVFQSASTITGNVPPVHNISMGFAVGAILIDVAGNRLYVANTSGNVIDRLEGASLQGGSAVVAASITGAATALGAPHGLALDGAGRLIVSNGSGPSITMYSNASSANGNTAPSAELVGAATQLAGPGQIVVNPSVSNGELYVADSLGGAILIFSNLAGINGNVAPTRVVSGGTTGLVANSVSGVALDTTR
jgi:DNA-binding beta-propeller fold protein YncE